MDKKIDAVPVAFDAFNEPGGDVLRVLEEMRRPLQCEARAGSVWCVVDGKWYTIENKPLPVPWGVE